MVPLKLIAALLAVTLVAGCGPDTPNDGSSQGSNGVVEVDVTPAELDDAEVARLLFEAAADNDLDLVPTLLPPRVSRVRAAVLALHDQLLERREGTPPRAAILAAIRRLADAEGGADAEALGPLVDAWSAWTDEQAAVEAALASQLSVGASSLMLPAAPGAQGLDDLARKAAEAGEAPPMSPANAGILFLRYAALALGEEGSDVSAAQSAALVATSTAFTDIGWTGGFAMLAEPVAAHLRAQDAAGVRSDVIWSAAAVAYVASGDLLRAGEMYIDQARFVWHGQLDAEAATRAATFAGTGHARIAASGERGLPLFRACYVYAAALQATGRHALAATTAAEGLALRTAPDVALEDAGDLGRIRAVSLFHLRRFAESLAACDETLLFLGADFVAESDSARALPSALREIAAQCALRLDRPADAVEYLDAVIAFFERERGQPWAADESRVAAELARADALARSGDVARARAAIAAIVAAGPQHPSNLAKIADIFLAAGLLGDADQVVQQGEVALGAERAPVFGELRGRIAAARGDLPAARAAFQGAVDYVTGGDTTYQTPRAALILESWARVEEQAGNRSEAADLFHHAANHCIDNGMQVELERLLAEEKRLRARRAPR